MYGRERRERFRRDYSPRPEGRSTAPPSRHLWIGNLSHHINETALSENCLRFGELESLAFQPGRSYAFVNYTREEDAIVAHRSLQGLVLSGLPLKIEFAKAERSLASSNDEYQHRRDERRSVEHGTPFQRDSRARPISPETLYTDKYRTGDKNAEPSEVLWIGFPSYLNVNEMILRKSFSPFGIIEKITAFPGRPYAFVRFRSVTAACRAKEALQGRLFDNPRVSICFAKSEMNSHEQGRNSMNPPLSPHFKSNGHPGRSTEFRHDRKFGNSAGEPYRGSPRFMSDLESRDSRDAGFSRKVPAWADARGSFEPMDLQGSRTQLGLSEDFYERQMSPARDGGRQHRDFSPSRLPRKTPMFEDHRGMQDNFVFHEAKKLKTGPFPPDKELPEYPFSDSTHDKHHSGLSPAFPNFPEHVAFDKDFGSGPFTYNRKSDRPMALSVSLDERSDNWNTQYNKFETGSGSLSLNPVNWKKSTLESHQSPLKEEWKWEGTIAKGGTPVCRARCFPVGKVVDIMLPEFLNCTARTSLNMLAKHFYQAANAWVVFFVPESDADIALYNEFMHYLGEKERAAVAKLGEKTSLFLVPPSDFSEQVLKVPGKLSISGVILRFQDINSEFGGLNQPLEAMDSKLPSFKEDVSDPKPSSTDLRTSAWGLYQSYSNLPSESFPSSSSFANLRKPELDGLTFSGNVPGPASSASLSGSTHLAGRLSEASNESRYFQHQQPQLLPNWSAHPIQKSNSGTGNFTPRVSSNASVHSSDPITKEHHFMKPGIVQETSGSHFPPGISDPHLADSNMFSHQETKSQLSSSLSTPSLQPEQLAHLASLLVQRQQSSGPVPSLVEGHRHPPQVNKSEENTFLSSQKSSQNHASSNAFAFQFGQVQEFAQQESNAPIVSQTASSTNLQMGDPQSQANQPIQMTNGREEEPNPHTRLQATLQLAATLLQQIQQQAKGADQR